LHSFGCAIVIVLGLQLAAPTIAQADHKDTVLRNEINSLERVSSALNQLIEAVDMDIEWIDQAALDHGFAELRFAATDLPQHDSAGSTWRRSLIEESERVRQLLSARTQLPTTQSTDSPHAMGQPPMAFESIIRISRHKLADLKVENNARRDRLINEHPQKTPIMRYASHIDKGLLLPIGILSLPILLAAVLWWRFARRDSSANPTIQRLIEGMPDATAVFDPHNRLLAANDKLLDLLPVDLAKQALLYSSRFDLYALLSPDSNTIERTRQRAEDSTDPSNDTIAFDVPGHGRQTLLFKERSTPDGCTIVTVTARVQGIEQRWTDPLTDLPNRTRLVSELAQRCSRTTNELALVIVDLRSFRQINDTYGRQAGDELLKQTAACLRHGMPQAALISRTAGDEFAVLIEVNGDRGQIENRVSKFLHTLRQGLTVVELNVPVRASIGMAFAPEHGNTVSALLRSADSACSHAKRSGDNSLEIYNSEQQQQAKRRHQLEVGLQLAIEREEFFLHYQPQIDIATRMTCGMEALLRWRSKEFGVVSPTEFVDIAEQTGIITRVGLWVLRKAIQDYQRLATFGMQPSILSVNLSRKQFDQGRIVDDVADVLEETGFDSSKLCLEITETALFRDSSAMRRVLHNLTSLGARLSIDDFGVGYSSLLELRDFPISEVKIDRAFISNIAQNRSSQDIVRAIVDIASSIGAEVVAEGIENDEQFETVASLGCHRAQGFYLCEPMPATTFPDVVLNL